MDDAEILGLYRQRSELALLETKEKYEALGMTIAYNMLGSREDAEECMNDVLLRLRRSVAFLRQSRRGMSGIATV